jgi:nicotinate-nucleotide adenylyltransferase
MRVAIFGGSFNPPHVSHQLCCAYVLATARVDRVWMMPTYKHPFDKLLASYADRVAMCERAAAIFNGRVTVSRLEEELGGESYTLRTVKALRQRFPEHQLALAIGADLVGERERWHGWDELQTLVEFILIGRSGEASLGGLQLPPISSTEVRARIARGEPVDGLVAADVIDYIREHELYR